MAPKNTGVNNSNSIHNQDRRGAGLDISFEYRGRITRSELETLETTIKARLMLAQFKIQREPWLVFQIRELQKQLLIVKTTKAGLS